MLESVIFSGHELAIKSAVSSLVIDEDPSLFENVILSVGIMVSSNFSFPN